MTTPEAWRVEKMAQRLCEAFYEQSVDWPHMTNQAKARWLAVADAALTTQAETIRRLEGEVARLKERQEELKQRDRWLGIDPPGDKIVSMSEEQYAALQQRAEAAEGRVRVLSEALEEIMPRYREMFEHLSLGDFTQSAAYGIAIKALSLATGEGA